MARTLLAGIVGVLLCVFAPAAGAATNYVNCAMRDYTGHDGSSPTLAFETIQEAVDVAEPGDTVLVAPGVYAKGGRVDTVDNTVSNRVTIGKSLTLKSLGGAARTVIKGEFDNSSETKTGAASMRCIGITSDTIDVVIEGFSITGGSTLNSDNKRYSSGAGVCGYNREISKIFIVDCVVSNNWGSRGVGVFGCTSVRTLFCDNHSAKGGYGVSIRYGNAANCIFNEWSATNTAFSAVDAMHNLVNCTFACCQNPINSAAIYNPIYANCVVAACDKSFTVDANPAVTLKNFVSEGSVDAAGVRAGSSNWSANVAPALVAPILCDFRPVAGGAADGTGDPTNLEREFLPVKYRATDFYGNPRVTSGTTCLGAIEGAVAVKTGLAYFPAPSCGEVSVNGYELKPTLPDRARYASACEWPVQWRVNFVTRPGGGIPFAFIQKGAWSGARFFDRKGGAWLSPPPVGNTLTTSVNRAGLVRWVSQETGDDDYMGADLGSEAHPYATIQKAVIAVTNQANGAVFVKAGVYDSGVAYEQRANNRVAIGRGLRLEAVDGPERTFIVGAKDTSVGSGCGSASIRCVAIKSGVQAGVCGFTLTGGASQGSSSYGGGAFMASSLESQLIDCIVTNNASSRGAAAWGGWHIRCIFSNNTTASGGNATVRNGVSSGCVFYSNNSQSCVVGDGHSCYNCTLIASSRTASAPKARLYNCIVNGASLISTPDSSEYLCGNVLYNISTLNAREGFVIADPLLVDASAGDTRLRPNSPAIGAGDANVPDYAQYTTGGLDGEGILVKDGKPTAGARHKPVVAVQVVARASGEIEPSGMQYVDQGAVLTVTAKGSEKRRFLGFWADGELVDTAGAKTFAYVAPAAYCAEPIELMAAYATNWYVNADATVGNDANNGWTPETAKRTLVEAMKGPVAGDTVHAAVGVYKEGTVADGENSTTQCRVNVPSGVTLLGDDRDETIIEGKASTADSSGLGVDAVRGVYLSANAKLKNLTVRQGYTKSGTNSAESRGAGVLGENIDTSIVEDCTIRDCCGSRSGAGQCLTFNRCRLIDNYGKETGSAGRNCNYYNTYIIGCSGNSRAMQETTWFVNSTYDVDKVSAATVRNLFGDGSAKLENAVFLQTNANLSVGIGSASNCVFVEGSGIPTASVVCSNVRTNTLEEIALDAERVPTLASCLVDAGKKPTVERFGDLDCDCGQRVYNGIVDIGAFECDWRAQYAKDLVSKHVTVTAADPQVVEENGAVYLPSGEMSVKWTGGVRNVRVAAEVTGTGVLEMYVGHNPEPVHCWRLGSELDYWWPCETATADVLFRYVPGADDEGGAYVKALYLRGFMITVK